MNPIFIAKTNCRNLKSPVRLFVIAAGAALILVSGVSSSCSTARGFGQDVEKTGDKIQEAAHDVAN
ncbi:MAG: entericidin A/B family lipoprotein [Verrucomicrobiota bacterium]